MAMLALFLIACHQEKPEAEALPLEGVLSITSPEAAAWMPAGDTDVVGTATGIDAVALNGVATTLADSEWRAPFALARGVNVLEATGTDGRGDAHFVRSGVLAGTFASPDGPIADAARFRVNRGGIDKIEDLVEGYVEPDLLNAGLSSLNPVYEDSYGVWGWDAVTIQADITHVAFSTADIQIGTTNSEIVLTATLPDVQVDVRAYGDAVGFDFDEPVSVGASEAVIEGQVLVTAVDGQLDVQLDSVTVDLRDIWYDTDVLPGDIESYLLVDTIRDTLEGMLVEKVTEMVPPLLDSTLSGLDPSFETEMLGLPVSASFSFADVDVDPDGLALTMDVDVSVPTGGTHTYAGFLAAGEGDPTIDTHADISGALSDDLLNRMVFEAWRGGLLDLRLSTDDGTLEGALLTPFKASEGTITVNPMLPPVIVQHGDALQAQMGELIVDIDTPGGGMGNHLEAAVDLFVDLDVGISGGSMVVGLGEPTVVLTVRDSDWGASDEATTRLLEANLPIDTLLLLLGDLSFPMPELYGIGFDSGTAARDADGVHTDMEIGLR
jgi:hypothetical protein